MAWNTRQTKTAAPAATKADVGVGAPVSYNPSLVDKPYRDSWDIERAYREGPQKITWVFRSVDAIAGNQARLPMVLRDDNSPGGKIIPERNERELYSLLNSKTNPGENSFVFRYRVSAQLLMSTRGVFIEMVRGRDGRLLALQLLPPQHTAPIPDPKNFVKGFQVDLPGGQKTTLRPDQVIWVRRPHPLNPYLSLTPMESAGFAIEIENLAKLYNRNFLLNDGRPGGLLVVRGEMDEDDKDELRSRFRGNMARAGMTTVIASEDGVDYVDTSASPRDAAYLEMRNLTKEEILAAFGVPESVIGNAAGRCLRQSELVRLASGERVRAGDLVGRHFTLMTSTPQGHIEVPAWATLEQVETCYRVTTESGKVLETNGRHPLYAARYVPTKQAGWGSRNGPKLEINEWTPVADLADGDWVIAVPSVITPTSCNDLTEDEAFVLGALVGDGTMTGDGKPVALSTPEGPFPKRFVQAVEAIGDDVIHVTCTGRVDSWRVRARTENRVGSGRGAKNSVRTRVLLRRAGLMGTTSHTKSIPELVFGASNDALAAFLGGLFAADGSVHLGEPSGTRNPHGVTTISLVSVSERLVRDTQEALLRFGVQSRLRFRSNLTAGLPSLEGRRFSSWELAISDAESILNFAASIEVPGKQDKINRAAERSEDRLGRGRIQTWKTRGLNPGLRWERVVDVEEVGVDQTIGIMVPGEHTYLSVFWEHNTFSNAAEEVRVFWLETMLPHMEPIARAFDGLHDKYYVDFDTSQVPILILAKQERERYLLDEFSSGLISGNEYRVGTGRSKVDSELMDAMLANPNLTPIGNTDKAFRPEQQQPVDMGAAPSGPGGGVDAMAAGAGAPQPSPPPAPDPAAPTAGPVEAGKGIGSYAQKQDPVDIVDVWDQKAEQASDRWVAILERSLERIFERQQRVVTEKATGAKARRALAAGTLTAEMIFDGPVWDRQFDEDLRPVLAAIAADAAELVAQKSGQSVDSSGDEFVSLLDEQMARLRKVNESTKEEVAAAVLVALALRSDDTDRDTGTLDPADTAETVDRVGMLKTATAAIFAGLLGDRQRRIAEIEARSAYNGGGFLAATVVPTALTKTWVTRRDGRVRSAHRELHGATKAMGELFSTSGGVLRFPGDPAAPPELTQQCRCRLRFDFRQG